MTQNLWGAGSGVYREKLSVLIKFWAGALSLFDWVGVSFISFFAAREKRNTKGKKTRGDGVDCTSRTNRGEKEPCRNASMGENKDKDDNDGIGQRSSFLSSIHRV